MLNDLAVYWQGVAVIGGYLLALAAIVTAWLAWCARRAPNEEAISRRTEDLSLDELGAVETADDADDLVAYDVANDMKGEG